MNAQDRFTFDLSTTDIHALCADAHVPKLADKLLANSVSALHIASLVVMSRQDFVDTFTSFDGIIKF